MGASTAQVLAKHWDVLVVGGGPAGLTAARLLALDGFSVLVAEEHEAVGDPVHCTGVLGLDAFNELDLPRETILAFTRDARFHSDDGRAVTVDACGVAAAVIDRGRFDRALADRATASGAVIATGLRVDGLTASSRGVDAVASGRTQARLPLSARACVIACGAQYRFNRQLGLGLPRAWLLSAQAETPFAAVNSVDIDLDRAVAPGGFGWLVPFRRNGAPVARIGLMAEDRAAGRFARYTALLAKRYEAAPVAPRPRVKMLPLGPVRRTYADRVVVAGDAAGLAKPTTGGGIYYALLSGQYAAEELVPALKQDRLDASLLRRYEGRWQTRLGPELRAGLAFRTLASRLDNRAVNALLELATIDGIVPLLQRTADFNWHRQAALALLRDRGFRRIVLGALWR